MNICRPTHVDTVTWRSGLYYALVFKLSSGAAVSNAVVFEVTPDTEYIIWMVLNSEYKRKLINYVPYLKVLTVGLCTILDLLGWENSWRQAK